MWLFPLKWEESCTLTYAVNEKALLATCIESHQVDQHLPRIPQPTLTVWSVAEFTQWDNSVKKDKHHPATQAHNHSILPDSHFLFFCWFLLSHSISLGLDHRYFTALSLTSPGCLSSLLPFSVLIVISPLFASLWCFVHELSQPVACKKVSFALLLCLIWWNTCYNI